MVALAERLISPNSTILKAEVAAREMRRWGGESRLVPSRETVDVEAILRTSLLGLGGEIEVASLNPRERCLYQRFIEEGILPETLLSSDLDGVWTSPAHSLSESGHLNDNKLRDFARLSRYARRVFLRTCRRILSEKFLEIVGIIGKIFEPLRKGNIGRFPILEPDVEDFLSKNVSDKIEVIPGKWLIDSALDLYELIKQVKPDFTYVIGSSEKDRGEMIDLFAHYPGMAGNVVFFDTCHRYL